MKEFIASEKPLPYRKLVAEVNLVAALIRESKWIAVDSLLQEIIKTYRAQK